MKKVMIAMMAVIFIFGIRSVTVDAATSGKCGTNATWSYENGTLTISGTGEMRDYSSGAQPWKDYRYEIVKVVVNEGIINVGESAFNGASNLKEVILADSIKRIGTVAFSGCKFESIELPKYLTYLGWGAFNNC
ncbi:MAG: leucine-rich repeat domain-containing protein, partial [Lachnospiraceae bacterium]|nr:leucine-rich repeat domain-containing protein [Lachnospiraceae bacterium]